VYAGVSSQEELLAGLAPGYRCCTFRGSVVAVDARAGGIVWRTHLTPDNGGRVGGYSGVAVWGTTAVVDAPRGALYVTTGNNYDLPAEVKACEKARLSDPSQPSCLAPDDHVACALPGPPRPKCPDPAGPDYDFAQGAMLFTAQGANGSRQLLGAGQKSGIFWALDPATGAVVWSTVVGPGGTMGGMEWGSATDGSRVYAAVANWDHKPYTLFPSGEVTRGGAWSALDAATGAILWQTATPGREDGHRPRHRSQRRRLRGLDGPLGRQHVRARRGDGDDPVAIPQRRIRQQRPGRRRRRRLLGIRLRPSRARDAQQQALRLRASALSGAPRPPGIRERWASAGTPPTATCRPS
jgi:polyvinyl alcohol dehydrogenase (cytochrome)